MSKIHPSGEVRRVPESVDMSRELGGGAEAKHSKPIFLKTTKEKNKFMDDVRKKHSFARVTDVYPGVTHKEAELLSTFPPNSREGKKIYKQIQNYEMKKRNLEKANNYNLDSSEWRSVRLPTEKLYKDKRSLMLKNKTK